VFEQSAIFAQICRRGAVHQQAQFAAGEIGFGIGVAVAMIVDRQGISRDVFDPGGLLRVPVVVVTAEGREAEEGYQEERAFHVTTTRLPFWLLEPVPTFAMDAAGSGGNFFPLRSFGGAGVELCQKEADEEIFIFMMDMSM